MNTLFPKPSQTTFFSQLPYLCVYCTTIDFDLSLIRQLLFCLTKCHIICYLKVCRSAQSHMLVWAIMEKLKLKGFVHPSVHVDQANVAVKMGAPKRDKIMCVVLLRTIGRKRVCTVLLRIDWQQVWGLYDQQEESSLLSWFWPQSEISVCLPVTWEWRRWWWRCQMKWISLQTLITRGKIMYIVHTFLWLDFWPFQENCFLI